MAQENTPLRLESNLFKDFKAFNLDHFTEKQHSTELSFFNSNDELYSCKVVKLSIYNMSFGLNYRMEDEVLPYDNSGYLISEAYYFDLTCGITVKNTDFKFSIENLIGFNNQDFSIDPFLVGATAEAETINFSHEAIFLISVSITYNL